MVHAAVDRGTLREEMVGDSVSKSTLSRLLIEDGLQPKRGSVGASERDEFLRPAWRTLVSRRLHAGRFVFVDECSTNTSLSPIYGWARRGQRVCFEVPRNWGANVTSVSSMSLGMESSLAVEGATTKGVFETYVERVLTPTLKPQQIVVMGKSLLSEGSSDQKADRGGGAASYSTCRPTPQTDLNPP